MTQTTPDETQSSPKPTVTTYNVTVRDDFTATVNMEITGTDGDVTLTATIDARDTPGHITRTITIDGAHATTTFEESSLPEWRPGNLDVYRDSRALRAQLNVRYISRAERWYTLYQQMSSATDETAAITAIESL